MPGIHINTVHATEQARNLAFTTAINLLELTMLQVGENVEYPEFVAIHHELVEALEGMLIRIVSMEASNTLPGCHSIAIKNKFKEHLL